MYGADEDVAGGVEGIFVWGGVAQGGDEHGPYGHAFCYACLAEWRLEKIRTRWWAKFFVLIFLHYYYYYFFFFSFELLLFACVFVCGIQSLFTDSRGRSFVALYNVLLCETIGPDLNVLLFL